ncbi:hypothetical protein PSPO01_08231 [Paraphaeosphaeria sporulosa]
MNRAPPSPEYRDGPTQMASKDAGKGVRITLACNACRSRKHRYFGRPQCAQCASNNVTCTWPAQQKRGPPKHYINSLEVRLLETEAVLLSLLSQVSTEQLKASFESLPPTGRTYNDPNCQPEQNTVYFSEFKQDVCKPSYWSSFPLDSDENVRRWWEDRMSRVRPGQLEADFVPGMPLHESLESEARQGGLPGLGVSLPVDSGLLQHTGYAEQAGLNSTGTEMNGPVTTLNQSTSRHGPNVDMHPGASMMRNEDAISTTTSEVSETLLSPDTGSGALIQIPDEFKQEFLW